MTGSKQVFIMIGQFFSVVPCKIHGSSVSHRSRGLQSVMTAARAMALFSEDLGSNSPQTGGSLKAQLRQNGSRGTAPACFPLEEGGRVHERPVLRPHLTATQCSSQHWEAVASRTSIGIRWNLLESIEINRFLQVSVTALGLESRV